MRSIVKGKNRLILTGILVGILFVQMFIFLAPSAKSYISQHPWWDHPKFYEIGIPSLGIVIPEDKLNGAVIPIGVKFYVKVTSKYSSIVHATHALDRNIYSDGTPYGPYYKRVPYEDEYPPLKNVKVTLTPTLAEGQIVAPRRGKSFGIAVVLPSKYSDPVIGKTFNRHKRFIQVQYTDADGKAYFKLPDIASPGEKFKITAVVRRGLRNTYQGTFSGYAMHPITITIYAGKRITQRPRDNTAGSLFNPQ